MIFLIVPSDHTGYSRDDGEDAAEDDRDDGEDNASARFRVRHGFRSFLRYVLSSNLVQFGIQFQISRQFRFFKSIFFINNKKIKV